MHLALLLGFEQFRAEITLKRLPVVMRPNVTVQIRAPEEGLGALATLVGPRPRVLIRMATQLGVRGERLRTESALVGLLLEVGLLVGLVVGLGLEAFAAAVAGEGAETGVDEEVFFQVIFVAAEYPEICSS
jgi:hypothetical protein